MKEYNSKEMIARAVLTGVLGAGVLLGVALTVKTIANTPPVKIAATNFEVEVMEEAVHIKDESRIGPSIKATGCTAKKGRLTHCRVLQ